MKKFVSEEESYYNDYKEAFNRFIGYSSGFKEGRTLENSYFYIYAGDEVESDEHLRLCIILPLIKYEIENNLLTKELLEELEIYYEDFNNGEFDEVLYEHEYDEIKKDLYWCFENRK